MFLFGSLERYTSTRVLMPDRYLQMIKRFGGYFQNLTITVQGFIDRFPQECTKVITELSTRCRLESLTLDVGVLISKTDFSREKPRKTDLKMLVSLVAHAFRMKSFNLKAWPMYRGMEKVDILDALRANKKLQYLEKLSIFWRSAEDATWATQNAILPSPKEMLKVSKQFLYMRSLSLRSSMLSDEIILELAQSYHVPLERLEVLVTYSMHDSNGAIPEIQSASWKALTDHCPSLQVEFSIVTRMPFIELAGLLKPEVPVAALGFMKYARVGAQDLQSITDKYSRSLKKFVSYADTEGLDDDLVTLVTKCPHLIYFVYHGEIHQRTVQTLAKIRAADWFYFQVLEKSVLTSETTPAQDTEIVVGKRSSGEFYLARTEQMLLEDREEELREERLKDLATSVSAILKQKWYPMDVKVIEASLEGGAASTLHPERTLQLARQQQN